MDNLKILLLACLFKSKSGNAYGGAEKSIINLSNWLSHHGYDVFLASVEGQEKSFDIDCNVHYLSFDWKQTNKIFTHLQIFRNTQKAINVVKPDVIISFWIHPMLYSIFNPYSWRKKIVFSERNDPKLEYGTLSRILRYFVLLRANHIVFQTEEAQRYFKETIKKKSVVIHNPIYIKNGSYPINEMDNRVVTVGRLNAQKNISLLINAFRIISKRFPKLELEIYGEGPLRSELELLINQMGIQKTVHLMGAHKDVLDKIYGSRLFVLPSLYEGMPNALMEAMALGIPVISSDCPCGGPRELIVDSYNGFLFKNDDEDDLVEKLNYMLSLDEKLLRTIRENEKEIINTHSQDIIFDKWDKLISE